MNFAAEMYTRTLMGLSREEIGTRMRDLEREQGFTIVTDAKWFDHDDWDDYTIISQDSRRIRLVALQAHKPGLGAFTRLVAAIYANGLVPVIVAPNELLTGWCHRHDYRARTIGKGRYRHEVWYPRRSAY